jgi:thioredoxin-dependent peroxiredoxin
VVLYFYPKDDTSGCTAEAQAFTEHAAAFEAAGAVIVGISKDSVKSHDKFVAKYGLGVILVSDEGSDVCETLRRLGREEHVRQEIHGDRAVDLPDRRHRQVRNVWRKVKVPGHAEEVLAAVRAL